jgi:hypothetical protein
MVRLLLDLKMTETVVAEGKATYEPHGDLVFVAVQKENFRFCAAKQLKTLTKWAKPPLLNSNSAPSNLLTTSKLPTSSAP